jgi:hypothetical protein
MIITMNRRSRVNDLSGDGTSLQAPRIAMNSAIRMLFYLCIVSMSECSQLKKIFTIAESTFFDLDGRRADSIPTFESYLTEVAGPMLHPGSLFRVIHFDDTNVSTLFSFGSRGDVDFVYARAASLACFEIHFRAAPLVFPTLGADRAGYTAVLYARNDSSLTISELEKGVTISLPTSKWLRNFLPLSSIRHVLHSPSRLLRRDGPDPTLAVIADLLSGAADAVLLPSGAVDLLAARGRLHPTAVRPIHTAGRPTPPTHPARLLAALPWVDGDARRAVAAALMRIPPGHPAAVAGGYSAWLPAPSLQDLRSAAASASASAVAAAASTGKCGECGDKGGVCASPDDDDVCPLWSEPPAPPDPSCPCAAGGDRRCPGDVTARDAAAGGLEIR